VKRTKEDYEETMNDGRAGAGRLRGGVLRPIGRAARADPAFPGATLIGRAPVRRRASIGREAGGQGGGRRAASVCAAPAFEAGAPINEDAGREPELAAGRPSPILGLIHECFPYQRVLVLLTGHNMRKWCQKSQ
jgi:hypothetical protein